MSDLFKEGGPYKIRKQPDGRYLMTVSVPDGTDGRSARECPDEKCLPGYFKVKCGTGIVGSQAVAYCPYCRTAAEPDDFHTSQTRQYLEDIVRAEAVEGVERMLKRALGMNAAGRRRLGEGLISFEMSLKSSPRRPPRAPVEEELRRDVVCPHCGLDQSVYGLATWCADCGEDIYLTHVAAEFAVVDLMLGDVERRRAQLGVRIAAKDLENCLEDNVSIFEAALKALLRRALAAADPTGSALARFDKQVRNRLQSVDGARTVVLDFLQLDLLGHLSENDVTSWTRAFEKRHPITHNLGVVDQKYLQRFPGDREGREVRITAEEVKEIATFALEAIRMLHVRLFVGADATRAITAVSP